MVKQLRIKAQALTLVLIVVVVSIIIAFSITTRVIEDIKQQGEERSSTRAEALAQSAIENITQKIQSGDIVATADGASVQYGISSQNPTKTSVAGNLALCDPNSEDVSKQCDAESLAQIAFYNMIVQFKVFNSENIEVHLTDSVNKGATSTFNTPKKDDATRMIIHVRSNDDTYVEGSSKLMVKGYSRTASKLESLSECIISLSDNTSHCLPDKYMTVTHLANGCPDVTLNLSSTTTGTSNTVSDKLGDKCYLVQNTAGFGNGVSFYRIKPLLTAKDGKLPYIDISATGTVDQTNSSLADYELPVPQMAIINSGVYSGTSANAQQVFQQSTRLILVNKAVPEIADYVLYNGSGSPITKK
jgi:hypothetical protein